MQTDTTQIAVANLAASEPTETPEPDSDLSFLNETAQAETPKEPEPTPEPAPEPKPTLKASAHSRTLIRRALELGAPLGITRQQIEAASADEIDEFIERQESLQQPKATPSEKPKDDEDETFEFDPAILSQMDPGIAKAIKAVPTLVKTNKQLKAELEQTKAAERKRQESAAIEMVDSAFEGLEDAKELFGEGGIADLKGTKEGARRSALYQIAGINFDTDGQKAINRKIKQAYETMYGDKPKAAEKPAEKPEEPKVKGRHFTREEFDAGVLGRPTATKKPTKSKQAAEEAMVAFYRDHDLPINGKHEEMDFPGVPD